MAKIYLFFSHFRLMFSSPPTHLSRGKFNIALGGGHVSLTTELGQSSLLTSLKSPVQTVDDLDTKRERPLNNSDNNFQTGWHYLGKLWFKNWHQY